MHLNYLWKAVQCPSTTSKASYGYITYLICFIVLPFL